MKRILFGLLAAGVFSMGAAPVATAATTSLGTYNFDELPRCQNDGNYMVYVAHYQNATGYTCDEILHMPPNTPQCPTPNPDGCIGTWYRLNLHSP